VTTDESVNYLVDLDEEVLLGLETEGQRVLKLNAIIYGQTHIRK
jgi:hypothetical protein